MVRSALRARFSFLPVRGPAVAVAGNAPPAVVVSLSLRDRRTCDRRRNVARKRNGLRGCSVDGRRVTVATLPCEIWNNLAATFNYIIPGLTV